MFSVMLIVRVLLVDLALVAVSSLISNTFSIVQQGHDISWYTEVVQTQFQIKQQLPANDPELAIAGGSYGLDLGLYYIRESAFAVLVPARDGCSCSSTEYYSYNVQAMLVMFWYVCPSVLHARCLWTTNIIVM